MFAHGARNLRASPDRSTGERIGDVWKAHRFNMHARDPETDRIDILSQAASISWTFAASAIR